MNRNKLHIPPGLLLAMAFFTALVLFNMDVPFFWDSAFFSQLAHYFYENGAGNFIAPLEIDTGSFPFYSAYMTLAWKLFGKTLAVSHLALLPWVLGVVWQYHRFAKRFLEKPYVLFSLLLLMLEPTFSTQSLIMGYDVPLVFLFLFSLNSLLENKRVLYTVLLCLLTLYSVRSMVLVPALFLMDTVIFYRIKGQTGFFRQKPVLHYLFPLVSLSAWLLYHHSQTGWYILSPFMENRGGELNSFFMMMRQMLFSAWQLADFGRIFTLVFLLVCVFILRNKILTSLFLLLIISFLIHIVFMAPLSNPLGHRYFLTTIVLLPVIACYALQVLNKNRLAYWLMGLFSLGYVTGNFWLYPERFGNGWDASLKVMPAFDAYEELINYTRVNNIDPAEVGTEYPFISDRKFTHLEDQNNHFMFLGDKPISQFHYVLRSNVSNTARLEEIQKIEKEWVLLKEIKSGQVYFRLYKNPGL